MKIYKSEPDEFGWYLTIHRRKDGVITIFKKNIYKDRKDFEKQIWFSKEESDFIRKILNIKSKQGEKK